MTRPRPVSIRRLPEKLDGRRRRLFFRELEDCMHVERPCIVLECSQLRRMDPATIHLLLCCLEEAMKRNGDVRLAALSPIAVAGLEMAGAEGLFNLFDTVEEAVHSFQRRSVAWMPRASTREMQQAAANAA